MQWPLSGDKMTFSNDEIYIVVECYDHDATHRVVVAHASTVHKVYLFFYVGLHPEISFGDTLLVNLSDEEFYVCRGNGKLTFKITPLIFPGTLLFELLSERLNA